MAKKQTQTAALDASAMYQIGAAGAAGTQKSAEKSGTSILSQFGRYALGLYMQAGENNKQSRKETTGLFAGLKQSSLESGIAQPHIDKWKKTLNEANKTINSVRGKLLPDSPAMVKAYEDREKILTNIQNASSEFKNYGPEKDYALSLVNRTYVVGKDTEKEARVGFGPGSTGIELLNSSLLANGSMEKAMDYDDEGFLVVQFTEEFQPFDGGYDNPNTAKIETKEDFTSAYKDMGTVKLVTDSKGNEPGTEGYVETKVQTIRLKDMEWATHANPNQQNLSTTHIGSLTSHGMDHHKLSEGTIGEYSLNLGADLDKLNKDPRAMVNYMFQENTWMGEDEDGKPKSMSLAEALVSQELHGFNDETSALIKEAQIDDPKTDIDESEITAEEMIGIRELMKQNILNGEYSTNSLRDMIHNKAVEAYNSNFKIQQDLIDESVTMTEAERARYEQGKYLKGIETKIDNKDDIETSVATSGASKGFKRALRWKDDYIAKGNKKVEAGWHFFYEKNGGWYFEDAWDGSSFRPAFRTDEDVKFFKGIK